MKRNWLWVLSGVMSLSIMTKTADAAPVSIIQTYVGPTQQEIQVNGAPQIVSGDWIFRIVVDTAAEDQINNADSGSWAVTSVTLTNAELGLAQVEVTSHRFYFENSRGSGLWDGNTSGMSLTGSTGVVGDPNIVEPGFLAFSTVLPPTFDLASSDLVLADGTRIGGVIATTLSGEQSVEGMEQRSARCWAPITRSLPAVLDNEYLLDPRSNIAAGAYFLQRHPDYHDFNGDEPRFIRCDSTGNNCWRQRRWCETTWMAQEISNADPDACWYPVRDTAAKLMNRPDGNYQLHILSMEETAVTYLLRPDVAFVNSDNPNRPTRCTESWEWDPQGDTTQYIARCERLRRWCQSSNF